MQSPSNQPANKPIQFNPLVFCGGLVLFLIIITCIIIIGVTLKSKLSKTNYQHTYFERYYIYYNFFAM